MARQLEIMYRSAQSAAYGLMTFCIHVPTLRLSVRLHNGKAGKMLEVLTVRVKDLFSKRGS